VKRVISFLIGMLIGAGILKADTLSLPAAQRLLFENNLDVRIAEARHQRASLDIVKSQAALYPLIEAYTSFGYQSEVAMMNFSNRIPLELPAGPGGMTIKDTMDLNINQEVGRHDRVECGVNLIYPFFFGMSPYFDFKAKERGSDIQMLALQALKNQLSLRLGVLFFQWELAAQKVAVQKTLIEQLREYHLQMRNLFEGGVLSQSKVLEARARLEKANADLLVVGNAVDSLFLEIRDYLQVSDTTALPQTYELRRLSKTGEPASVYTNPERPEFLALDRQGEQLDLYKKALFGRRLPGLFFNLGLRYGNPGVNMNVDQYMSWSVIGVQLKWTLYEGRENWAQRVMLQHDREMVAMEREKQQKMWEKASTQALLQLRKARGMQDATKAALAAAEAYAEDLKNALDAGVAISVDYLNALTSVTETKYSLASAEMMEKLAFLQLMYARGEEIQY
jgi:outer membrane protein TolC